MSITAIRAALVRGALAAGVAVAVTAHAGTVPGSAGYANLTASGIDYGESYAFSIDISYQIFNGQSASDPLGDNHKWQIAFALEHMGGAGLGIPLDVGRFTVYAATGGSYTAADAVDGEFLIGPTGHQINTSGGMAPSDIALDLDPPRGIFCFFDDSGLELPAFTPGQRSQLLVVTPAAIGQVGQMVIEVDWTLSSVVDSADTYIYLTSPQLHRCDMNCDGFVNFDDINPFVTALVGYDGYASAYPNCMYENGDCNQDGAVNFDDINPFVECLIAGGPP